MRSTAVLLLLLALMLPAGCNSDRSCWTYALSRKFYDSKNWERSWSGSSVPMKEGDGKAALGLAVFFLLPVIIDSAILPITGMHDILVAR